MNTQHDLSTEARSAKVDRLDDAIDAVAMRMTRVEENDAFATRILASLPDRSPWILHSWIPRLAITAALGIAATFVVLRTFDEGSTGVLRTAVISSASVEMAAAVPEHRATVEPVLIVRRTSVARSQNDRGTIVAADHERSLKAIEVPAALSLVSLAPSALPEDAPLTLAPLAIADLPLTAESISPR